MVSGVSTQAYSSATASTGSAAATQTAETTAAAATTADEGVVYEKSTETATKAKDTDRSEIIGRLKADQEARLSSLQSLVQKMFAKQGATSEIAGSSLDDLLNNAEFWNNIRQGNFEADEATIKQAQEDIAEGGYWSVEETSNRMVDFAKALAGNDVSKANTLIDAIKKGYEEAGKLWGGELPEISQKTLDATLEKMNKWIEEGQAE